MALMNQLKEQLNDRKQLTENGAVGYATSGKELLDFNFAVSSMRNWSKKDIINNFIKVYYENSPLAIKWLFYLRDIRGNGMGERRTFRVCFKWLVDHHLDDVLNVIKLIPEYGRYDDWLCLLHSKAGNIVLDEIRKQIEEDVLNMKQGHPVSLLAKWLPSINTSSIETRMQAKYIAKKLNYTEKEYRQLLSSLRGYMQVVEVKMSSRNWQDIDYSQVSSRANLIYGSAFLKNDEKRRREFLDQLSDGETKINADTLFPSDIVHKYYQDNSRWECDLGEKNDTLEALWDALPNYVHDDASTLVVRDGSGSMNVNVSGTRVRAIEISTALSIYFSQYCKGQFHNKFITFSSRPEIVDLTNTTCLKDKLEICGTHGDCSNTDLNKVFDLILNTALQNNLNQEDLPKNILIVSDMEFDYMIHNSIYGSTTEALLESIKEKYKKNGYQMPRLVFWNVCSRTNTIPLQENKAGIVLVSGFNPAVYNMVLSNELDPYKCLLEQVNSKRYDPIEENLRA